VLQPDASVGLAHIGWWDRRRGATDLHDDRHLHEVRKPTPWWWLRDRVQMRHRVQNGRRVRNGRRVTDPRIGV
jgi:hypothetical protein